jgi:predicted nucleic acid-binding protein
VIAVDASVVVAAFATWHELHEPARSVLDRGARLPAHAALESYSVLTRLPHPHRAPPQIVADFLDLRFPDPYLILTPTELRALLTELGESGIAGGAVYDALIGAVARAAAATLVTCDRRALPLYRSLQADARSLV